MAGIGVGFELFGIAELRRRFLRLETKVQKKIVRSEIRTTLKNVKKAVLRTLKDKGAHPFATGRLHDAMKAQRIVALPRSRTRFGVDWPMPTRGALGISADDKFYYPFAVEYGHTRQQGGKTVHVPAKSYIRAPTNRLQPLEELRMQAAIAKKIEAEAAKRA